MRIGEDFGEYRIDAELGRGGMGVVYRAWQYRMERSVALKVLKVVDPVDLPAESGYRERFAREAAALSTLDSPHVIQIHDHGEIDGSFYLAMQLVTGSDLDTLLRSGPLDPRRALDVVVQVASALGDAHAVGVVHRDVKPANVLLRSRAEHQDEDFVYLCDFGIARAGGDVAPATRPGGVVGTVGYLAPERLHGAPASAASDVYALGCLLWAALTGSPPYRGSDAAVMLAHLQAPRPRLEADGPRTAAVNDLLADMMATDAHARPGVRELRERARAIRDGRPVQAAPGTVATASSAKGSPTPKRNRPPSTSRPSRRPGPRLLWAGGAAVVVAAVAVVVALASGGPSPAERVADGVPIGLTCAPVDPGGDDVAARSLCRTSPAVGELRVSATSSPEQYLAEVAGRDLATIPAGNCGNDTPPRRQSWARGGHRGTLVCTVVGANVRWAWSDETSQTVSVLDGAPATAYPADVNAVAAFFGDLRYG